MILVKFKKAIYNLPIVFFVFWIIALNANCKNSNIEGDWNVKIEYNNLLKKKVIPEKSIFTYDKNNVFCINGKKTGKYKKKGDYIRILIYKKSFVIHGELIDGNTIKGDLKKIITDDIVAYWTAKRKIIVD
jgi:hypothetical protein